MNGRSINRRLRKLEERAQGDDVEIEVFATIYNGDGSTRGRYRVDGDEFKLVSPEEHVVTHEELRRRRARRGLD